MRHLAADAIIRPPQFLHFARPNPPITQARANLWHTSVGPRFFETFDIVLLAGRDFHDGDRTAGRAAIVNEAFARRFMQGDGPVGLRVRYASTDPGKAERRGSFP